MFLFFGWLWVLGIPLILINPMRNTFLCFSSIWSPWYSDNFWCLSSCWGFASSGDHMLDVSIWLMLIFVGGLVFEKPLLLISPLLRVLLFSLIWSPSYSESSLFCLNWSLWLSCELFAMLLQWLSPVTVADELELITHCQKCYFHFWLMNSYFQRIGHSYWICGYLCC